MLSREDNMQWLRSRIKEYHSIMNDIGDIVMEFEEVGKLGGGGVMSLDELKEIDMGGNGVKCPTYLNANLTSEQKEKVCCMLREFIDCFA
jgi:hypothetical protein